MSLKDCLGETSLDDVAHGYMEGWRDGAADADSDPTDCASDLSYSLGFAEGEVARVEALLEVVQNLRDLWDKR